MKLTDSQCLRTSCVVQPINKVTDGFIMGIGTWKRGAGEEEGEKENVSITEISTML